MASLELVVVLLPGTRGEPAQYKFLKNGADHALSSSDGETTEDQTGPAVRFWVVRFSERTRR